MSTGDPDSIVSVYSVMEPTRAEFLRVQLEQAGIECEVGGESQAGLTGTTRIDLLVRQRDAARAREIITEHEKGHL